MLKRLKMLSLFIAAIIIAPHTSSAKDPSTFKIIGISLGMSLDSALTLLTKDTQPPFVVDSTMYSELIDLKIVDKKTERDKDRVRIYSTPKDQVWHVSRYRRFYSGLPGPSVLDDYLYPAPDYGKTINALLSSFGEPSYTAIKDVRSKKLVWIFDKNGKQYFSKNKSYRGGTAFYLNESDNPCKLGDNKTTIALQGNMMCGTVVEAFMEYQNELITHLYTDIYGYKYLIDIQIEKEQENNALKEQRKREAEKIEISF